MLALKHRKNRNGGQRIIMFVGSPVDATPEELKKLGAVVKKNGVSAPATVGVIVHAVPVNLRHRTVYSLRML